MDRWTRRQVRSEGWRGAREGGSVFRSRPVSFLSLAEEEVLRLEGVEWHIVFCRHANILPRLVNSETRWLGTRTSVAKVVVFPPDVTFDEEDSNVTGF